MKLKDVTAQNRRFIQGAMLINAPCASLNLGQDGIKRIYTTDENGKSVKFSYLSGQFIKAKIRESLEEKGFKLSQPEIIQTSGKKNTPTTSCNPFEYLDDDLFGYMNIIDKGNHINKGTTRVAPFKISYFLGKLGDINKDYGVKQNGALLKDGSLVSMPLDDNNRQFASTQYSGCFSIDVNLTGRFLKGHIAGFKNLATDFPIDRYENMVEYQDEHEVKIKQEIRLQRLQNLLKIFPYLNGGAKRTTIYSDLAPKFVIYCITNCGNHLFQELSSIYKSFNIDSLKESVNDFADNIKSDIYIALKNGFLDSYRNELLKFLAAFNENTKSFKFVYNDDLGGVNELTQKFADNEIPKMFKVENI